MDLIRWRPLTVAALMLAAGIAAACGGSDNNKTSTNATTPQASAPAAAATTAASPTSAAAVATTAPATQASRTFTDDNGKTLAIAQVPKKVVALSPSMVELMYAVDAPPAARVSSANYPDAAKSVPDVGSSYQPSIEKVASFTPDLILADQQIQPPPLIAELQKIAPVFAVRVQNYDDVLRGLRTVGAIMGKSEQGEKAAKDIESKLAAVQAKLPQQRPSVFIMIGTADAFFAAKPNAFVGDLVAKLGGKNLVTEGPDAQFPGFTAYSLERLVQADPDVILVLTAGPPNGPKTSQALASNPAWAGLRAVKGGRVYEADPVTLVQSAGPRVSKDIDELAAVLYPGVFPPPTR